METKIIKILVCILTVQFICCDSTRNEDYFTVISKDNKKRYALKLKNYEGPVNGYAYSNLKPSDKIKMIQELLRFENDTRICSDNIMNYNPAAQMYTGPKEYSIQVEALFIINQLYFDYPFSFSPVPALVSDSNEVETIDGELIYKTYNIYKKWFVKLKNDSSLFKNHSLEKKSDLNFLLKQEKINWYGSVSDGKELFNNHDLQIEKSW